MEQDVKVGKKESVSVIVWFVVGILVGAGALFTLNSYRMENKAAVTSQMEQAKVKELIGRVGKLIILPEGEEPVVATINDAVALVKDQVFYKGANNGDIVLVYQKASKAVVYSPERNIIVNVGPIFLQDQKEQTPVKSSAAESTSTLKKK